MCFLWSSCVSLAATAHCVDPPLSIKQGFWVFGKIITRPSDVWARQAEGKRQEKISRCLSDRSCQRETTRRANVDKERRQSCKSVTDTSRPRRNTWLLANNTSRATCGDNDMTKLWKKKKTTHATSATFIATGRIFSPRSSYDIVMPDTQSRHQKTRRKFEKNLKITVSSDKRPSTMTQRRVTYITVNKLLGIDKCI